MTHKEFTYTTPEGETHKIRVTVGDRGGVAIQKIKGPGRRSAVGLSREEFLDAIKFYMEQGYAV